MAALHEAEFYELPDGRTCALSARAIAISPRAEEEHPRFAATCGASCMRWPTIGRPLAPSVRSKHDGLGIITTAPSAFTSFGAEPRRWKCPRCKSDEIDVMEKTAAAQRAGWRHHHGQCRQCLTMLWWSVLIGGVDVVPKIGVHQCAFFAPPSDNRVSVVLHDNFPCAR
jgi:hypothetical protein